MKFDEHHFLDRNALVIFFYACKIALKLTTNASLKLLSVLKTPLKKSEKI
jgi:hypothetical protein